MSGVHPIGTEGIAVRRQAPRTVGVARRLIGTLVLAASEVSVNTALAGEPGDGDVSCRWQQVSVNAAADACLLSDDPFSNYGLLDRL